jgi:hypothetical protein
MSRPDVERMVRDGYEAARRPDIQRLPHKRAWNVYGTEVPDLLINDTETAPVLDVWRNTMLAASGVITRREAMERIPGITAGKITRLGTRERIEALP